MIISVSGKIGSGKDTVGKLINYLLTGGTEQYESIEGFLEYYTDGIGEYPFKIKKFADKLKDITCILLGCTRDQLEDREFKETPLGEEWDFLRETSSYGASDVIYPVDYKGFTHIAHTTKEFLTPRKVLQLLGTDCIRNMIHPNAWVNALMSEYEPSKPLGLEGHTWEEGKYPNWIITDTRFPNELKAVKDRGGITIKVVREYSRKEWYSNNNIPEFFEDEEDAKEIISLATFIDEIKSIPLEKPYYNIPKICRSLTHLSETALDRATFDYVIDNNGTIEDLIKQVEKILCKI